MGTYTLDNNISNTQSASGTANPQTAVPADGASNAADFQSTAPTNALQESNEDLAVETTGQPLPAVDQVDTMNWDPYIWGVGAVLVVIVIVWAVRALIRESDAEAPKPKAATVSAPAKSSVKKNKTAPKKKAAPAKSRKKTTRKRR